MEQSSYYAAQSPYTDPGGHAGLFGDLPDNVAGLSRTVRGLVIHYRLAHLFGYDIPEARLPEIDTRYAQKMLSRVVELDDRPLTERRPPERRFVGC